MQDDHVDAALSTASGVGYSPAWPPSPTPCSRISPPTSWSGRALRHRERVAGAREHIASWPTAIVNVGLYFLVFRRAQLYADMWLQAIYLVLSCYGWYEWKFGGADRAELPSPA